MKKSVTILIIITIIFCLAISAQNKAGELDKKLTEFSELGHLPGFGVAVVGKDKIIFEKGYGYADLESKKPYTKDTIQNIGSISKTFIGVSLMRLVEEGKIDLDDKINDILPFKVINPHFPESPITVRHLATHTSTILDTDHYEKTYIFKEKINVDLSLIPKDYVEYVNLYNTNKSMPLVEFIKSIAVEGGKWYSKDNFLKQEPGTTYEYSNLGATLLSHIIEIKTGKSFAEYSKKQILKPLKMNDSGWYLKDVNTKNFTSQYLGKMQKLPKYSLITYADGGLITSVSDLSKFLMEMIKGYQGEGKILKKETVREMMSPQSKVVNLKYAISWRAPAANGYIGHTGGDPGTSTYMFFSPKTNRGMILFTNFTLYDEKEATKQFGQIWETLFIFNEDYDKKPLPNKP